MLIDFEYNGKKYMHFDTEQEWPEFTAEQKEQIIDLALFADIRAKRNRLLAESDYTQMPDSDLSDSEKLAWVAYRKELRMLPQNYTAATDVIWPISPFDAANK
ncbi:hypothetical protein N474_04940 [Pseudoalteromonas luteoviolacea CPMOR-2]|uniref:Phage tail assembly chaperone-like domain-containing protein n=1 Tax=Pseudoalteromonas luteoviolacea DSM 6061 TaxID=1365250 RepID=A0A161ZXD2_9GAMM|nr:tail fiber assembly protein [Pseudoalteromonas luteoviolacea]KZN37580.1 hypothetical protein N475_01850 [Pseudoalteromonas luteoviolacea DSM 6061]KZN49606.1 hypothetical protein N474_04940 [Pseudoalteromonas luteoviolacea CPMOR-2]MBE0387005.1 hypothetical protein [Pseudoalteromonas luteoviolacea DSM 6061]